MHVTDVGLLHLAHHATALTSLDVSNTAVGDRGVRCLVATRYRGAKPQATGGSAPARAADGRAASSGGGAARDRGGDADVIVLLSDSDSEDSDSEGQGGNAGVGIGGGGAGRRGGGGGAGLRHLNISSCRSVPRDMRHAAAEGLAALHAFLNAGRA
ncbi:hypothetical protein GPECTOR_4g721 [Gonium pectorale]|uniref:Uncharacterized protein n=1 Tax=Gonium pectorale TaxID=33097 RepID=A0A150GXW2_GONPE|nr:hypothetical protein GPECTOR_4g721 [Gonium pectorale]|eukprot:KXZ54655.1 hypothetical protein GPECTOR_4g721 [Gonium pectorale]